MARIGLCGGGWWWRALGWAALALGVIVVSPSLASARSSATGDFDANVVAVHSHTALGTVHGSIDGRRGLRC